jgi:hypothetical protein
MHPQRIEVLEYIFNKGTDIVLHNFSISTVNLNAFMNNRKNIEDYNIIYDNLIPAPSGCVTHKIIYENMGIIHHSQVSIKRELFDIVKFKEEDQYRRNEDCLFCSDILKIPDLISRKPEMGVFCSLFTKQIIMTSYMNSLLKKYENYTVSLVIHRLPRG